MKVTTDDIHDSEALPSLMANASGRRLTSEHIWTGHTIQLRIMLCSERWV